MKLDESDQASTDEPSSFLEPEWHAKIKTLKETVSGSQVIAAKDINADEAKIFALFNSHQHLLDYIYRILKEQRMIYE